MYALHLRFFTFTLLAVSLFQANNGIKVDQSSQRQGKAALQDTTEKSTPVADQIALASSRFRGRAQYRRGDQSYSTKGNADYSSYGNLELNLIRPDSNSPLRTEITTKYVSNVGKQPDHHFLEEDTETAEEYVAKAMGMYGAKFREPIRIPPLESSFYPVAGPQDQSYGQQPQQTYSQQSQQAYSQQQEQQEQQQQHEQGQHQQQSPVTFGPQYNQQQADTSASLQHQGQSEKQADNPYSSQQEQQSYNPYQSDGRQHSGDNQQVLEAHIQAQLQAQLQQAQQQLIDSSTERTSSSTEKINEGATQSYEKDPVTRRYEVFDSATNGASYESTTPQDESIERQYRTKYAYKPIYRDPVLDQEVERLAEEKVRVSASTEIPKAEIMKQIEKSVIKYMKELEAEGKILTAPQPETKTYYKVMSMPPEEKPITSTTLRPQYSSSTVSYHGISQSQREPLSASPASSFDSSAAEQHSGYSTPTRYHAPHKNNHLQKTHYSNTEGGQAEENDSPNVEFVYKIKTHTPLQRATVKTVSKPYTLSGGKSSLPYSSHFDHSSALKHMEDFDLSHVVTTQEPEEPSATTKPNKLYFNSDIYHDINSLPYKMYRKVKGSSGGGGGGGANGGDVNEQFKGYSGYFAEPLEKDPSSVPQNDDGYPLMNPYQYVLKKENLPSSYDEISPSSGLWEQTRGNSKPQYSMLVKSQKQQSDFDSYGPKFSTNPESLGYQQTYKAERDRDHGSGNVKQHVPRNPNNKRGKRGNGAGASGASHHSKDKKVVRVAFKDREMKLALRPPIKV